MKAVTGERTVVVVGARPRSAAKDLFSEVPPGGEATLLVLGPHPSPGQLRLTEQALALSAERRFTLIAQLVVDRDELRGHIHQSELRIVAGRIERRRWGLTGGVP